MTELLVEETREPFSPKIDVTYNKSGILRGRIKPPEEFCTFEDILIFCFFLFFVQYDC